MNKSPDLEATRAFQIDVIDPGMRNESTQVGIVWFVLFSIFTAPCSPVFQSLGTENVTFTWAVSKEVGIGCAIAEPAAKTRAMRQGMSWEFFMD